MERGKTKIDVKLALAEKYAHLSQIANSVPKRRTFAMKATKYRRQAEQMRRDGC
jgi:hypothetical protein